MASLNYSAATDTGRSRNNNEDCYLSSPELGLWAVADGMGGHDAGEVASAIVRDTLQNSQPQGQSLVEAIQQSHRAVLEAVNKGVGAPGMGSTVVALHSNSQDYEVAWVGDSRAYLWSPSADGGQLQQLTTDHSYVQLLLASGAITEAEVDSHPDKHVITQCLGSKELQQVRVDTVQGKWRQSEWILLCSDGLTDEVSDQTIADILVQAPTPQAAVDRLLQKALDNGGRDNVTIQVVESPCTEVAVSNTQMAPFEARKDGAPQSPLSTGLSAQLTPIALSLAVLIGLAAMLYWLMA